MIKLVVRSRGSRSDLLIDCFSVLTIYSIRQLSMSRFSRGFFYVLRVSNNGMLKPAPIAQDKETCVRVLSGVKHCE